MADDNKPSPSIVAEWLKYTTGAVHYTQACDGQFDRVYYPNLRVIFHRMVKGGVAESVNGKDGYYRLVDDSAEPVDWQEVEKHTDSGLILPFDLRKYIFVYPDTSGIVAGSKSSGKSGLLLRTVALNMNRVNTILLTNLEGGVGMLRDRFDAMDIEIPKPAPFKVIPVYEHHHDYIKLPNTLYVIDYIDVVDGEFYKIPGYLKKIDQKLQGLNSNAFIGLQKPIGRDTAFGKEGTLKNATFYLAMEASANGTGGKLKIVDAKVPANKKIHPKNMQWTFLFDQESEGTNFLNIQQSYNEE